MEMASIGDVFKQVEERLDEGWLERSTAKVGAAAIFGAVLAPIIAIRRKKPLYPLLPVVPLNTCLAVGSISVLQEVIRSARGHHDAWNSAAAGAIAGGSLLSLFFGRRYMLLGMLMWGTMAGVAHSLNDWLKPRHMLEDYLIYAELLDVRATRGRVRPVEKPTETVAQLLHEVPFKVLATDAERIKRQEVVALRRKMEASSSMAGQTSHARFFIPPSQEEIPATYDESLPIIKEAMDALEEEENFKKFEEYIDKHGNPSSVLSAFWKKLWSWE